MSPLMLLSLLLGAFATAAGYFIFLILHFEQPFVWALVAGACFALVLYPVFRCYDTYTDRRYKKMEATFEEPFLFVANGNIQHERKLRNANLYFFEHALVFLSLDGKPYLTIVLPHDLIERIEIEAVDVHIYTKDDRLYSMKTADAAQIARVLKQQSLIL